MGQQEHDGEAPRLVVVEDEEIILLSLTGTLTRLGYEVAGTATSGPEALRQIQEKLPDAVLLDLRLSGPMDGLAVARQLREFCHAPIIFTTAHASSLLQAIREVPGPCATVGKPFTPVQLHAAIQGVLHQGGPK